MKAFDYSRINAYTITRDLIRNIWLVLLAAFIGFVGCLTFLTYIYDKQYTSSMTVSINISGYTNQVGAQTLARSIVTAQTIDDVFQSEALSDVVKRDLGDVTAGKIRAEQMGDTNLINVTATANSPQVAYDTLKSVCENYPKVTDLVFKGVIISVVVNPNMPSIPSNAMSPLGTGIIIGFAFAVLAAAVIMLISYMRDTVKNVSDVETELDVKLFGTVFHNAMPVTGNKKQKMILTNPLVGYHFTESFRRMAIKAESLKRTKGTKVFAITSVTENEGKTTAAINLAVALAQNGNRVLIMDCDFKNPSIHYFFERENRPKELDFHNFVSKGGDISDYIYADPVTGLYVADSAHSCEGSSEKLSHNRFGEIVSALKKQFDFVIIDTPPCGIAVDAEIISESSDAVLVVVRQDVVNISEINDHIEAFNKSYIAGCIFNNIHTVRKIKVDQPSQNTKYYYHEQTNG